MIINLINFKKREDIRIVFHLLKEFADYFKIDCEEVNAIALTASDSVMQKFVEWLQEVKNVDAKFFVIAHNDEVFARCIEIDSKDAMMQTLKVGSAQIDWTANV